MGVRPAQATGLQPIGTSAGVRVQEVRYDLEVHGPYVAGRMEVVFTADWGAENAANLRFPLPPGAVLHHAEIDLPARSGGSRPRRSAAARARRSSTTSSRRSSPRGTRC